MGFMYDTIATLISQNLFSDYEFYNYCEPFNCLVSGKKTCILFDIIAILRMSNKIFWSVLIEIT